MGFPQRLLVADHVGTADGGEDANFVQRVLLLLVVQVAEANALQRVLLVVSQPLDLVHRAVGALACSTHPAWK